VDELLEGEPLDEVLLEEPDPADPPEEGLAVGELLSLLDDELPSLPGDELLSLPGDELLVSLDPVSLAAAALSPDSPDPDPFAAAERLSVR
jgi:hypothetical protein